ncbi:MAG: phosphatase PAP2 family protein [Gemmatimonadota bacterium]|nr:phosphatase PAP2 family protein [Gemmatimonadota bacterium]
MHPCLTGRTVGRAVVLVGAIAVTGVHPLALGAQTGTRADSARAPSVPGASDSAALVHDTAVGIVARPRLGPLTRLLHEGALAARASERFVFRADAAADRFARHRDPGNGFLREAAPIAYWTPFAAVAAAPVVWGDALAERRGTSAVYGGTSTAALALGFAVSRTAKHFVHRARPCTDLGPEEVSLQSMSDTTTSCSRGWGVAHNTSFFSEHAMAMFAIAAASSFSAQRLKEPHADAITAVSFSIASAVGVGRVYQRHHWLSDVLVGAAVGTGAGYLAAQLPSRVWQRREH